jgi:hypothetical protein
VYRLLVTAPFLVHWFLSPWWWRRYVPPKHRFLQEPHDLTSQKTPFFIVTAVKISNLTDIPFVPVNKFLSVLKYLSILPWRIGEIALLLFISTLQRREWLVSWPWNFTPEKSNNSKLIVVWAPDGVWTLRRKKLCTADWAIPTPRTWKQTVRLTKRRN